MTKFLRATSVAVLLTAAGCGDDGGGSPAMPVSMAGSGGGGPGSGGMTAAGGAGGAAMPSACGVTGGDPFDSPLAPTEVTQIRAMSPLPAVPANSTNKYADDDKAAALGQKLFFEKSYSGALVTGDDGKNGAVGAMGEAGKLSCASCHAGRSLDDQRSKPNNVSLGVDWLTRNSPTLINASFYRWTNWAGRFSAQWELPMAVSENPRNMNSDRMKVVNTVAKKYRVDYEVVFGAMDPAIGTDDMRFPASAKPKANAMADDGAWERMTMDDRALATRVFVNYGKALEAYMRKLVSRNAAFDKYVAGDKMAIDCGAKRGLKLFLGKANCASCHKGPHFSDQLFHNIGVLQKGEHVPMADNGRLADIPGLVGSALNTAGAMSDDRNTGRLEGLTTMPGVETTGQFRTASLRDVALTAPYMHAGQLATLEDVVDYYDRGGDAGGAGTKDALVKPLGLSADEKADLVAFLKTLTGEAVAAPLLVDTSAK